MNGRPPPQPRAPSATTGWRTTLHRRLVLHRRPVSATLAFAAVLFGLAAVTGAPHVGSGTGTAVRSPDSASTVSGGELEVPVRLADPGVASVISPGDVIDVVVAGPRAAATVVAAEVVVTALPTASDDSPWSGDDGLLMVAATDSQALALAGASARGPVTIVLHR